MDKQTREMEKTGPEAAKRLRALFARWAREEAKGLYDDELSYCYTNGMKESRKL